MDKNLVENEICMEGLLSIIITTYNREDIINLAVNSCLQQTYNNIEVIVVDDGSTDGTQHILAEFAQNEKFKYQYQENKERSAARNTGLRLAKGQYVKFLDSDDLIEKEYAEVCIKYFKENANCDLVHTNCKVLNEDGSISMKPKKGIIGNIYENLWDYNDVSLSAVMMKKTVFERWGGFDETRSLSGSEDWEYWVRLSKQGCIFGFVPAFVTIIKMHKDNSTMNDINKIVFSAKEGQKLLQQKFDIKEYLINKFEARLTYLEAIYFYIQGKTGKSLSKLFRAGFKNWRLMFKIDFWSLLLKNFIPKKIINVIKQKKA